MDTTLHVNRFLDRIIGDRNPITAPRRHVQIPQMIAQRWHSWNLGSEMYSFRHKDFTGFNLISGPQDPQKPFVLLTAHHDTVPLSPGLDDNGSGMAIIDAVAKMYVNDGKRLNLAFCMTDFEEGDPRVWDIIKDLPEEILLNRKLYWQAVKKEIPDVRGFQGARSLYEKLKKDNLLGNLEVVLNFDTVGYRSDKQLIPPRVPRHIAKKVEKGDFVAVVGNWRALGWMRQVKRQSKDGKLPTIRLTVPGSGKLIPDTRRADHAVFWDNKVPALFFTDTANFRNPNYHTPNDIEVDSSFIAEIAEFIYELLSKER
ncbi:MAG: M28 family peptidase [Candidatus Spechtbacterales bacterium]|nr:M28 family peptidase [Candidatus Spechtbacterales bacterium]